MGRLLIVSLLLITGLTANANPISGGVKAVGSLFKGGVVRGAEGVAARSTETAAGKALLTETPHTLAYPSSKFSINPEPIAAKQEDLILYKQIKPLGEAGNTDALLKMSQMTRSGAVVDSTEPHYGYWLFQAYRLGSQQAAKQLSKECSNRQQREQDQQFDVICRSSTTSKPKTQP